jgi:predicted aldo/keto reductase-like oxidoreductase
MRYAKLKGTDLEVSVVSLGSIGFMRGKLEAEGIQAIANRALDLGVNFIDTAYAYARGVVESALGPVVEKRRDEMIILTRSHMREPDEFKETMEGSFERLRTDYIDIFQLHDVTRAELYEQLMQTGIYAMLAEKVKEGRIGYASISTHGTVDLMREIVTCGKFSVITVAYNLTGSKRSQGDGEFINDTADVILPLAWEKNVGVTIMKPFGGGAVLEEAPDGTRLSPVKCLLYVLANPYVATVSPGVDSMEQLEEDLQAGQPGMGLSDEEKKELEEQGARWGQFFCRQCGYCLPCSEEIDIPKVMKALQDVRAASETPNRAKSLKEKHQGLLAKAADCAECGDCEERCPYDLPIVERMKEAADLLES